MERGQPVPLDVAARFLPLVAAEEPDAYSAWALRWLGRWVAERGAATVAQAAEVAATLADIPLEGPAAAAALQSYLA